MERVILLRSSKLQRQAKAQAIQHLAPALLLGMAGVETLRDQLLLGVFEIAAGALMFGVALWEIASKRHHEWAAVRWADLFAAAMLLGEGLHRAHAGGHFLPYAYVGLSVLTAVRAYVWKSFMASRRLVINDDGFIFRKRFRTIALPWTAARSIQIQESQIEITTSQGPVILDLSNLENREEIRAAFLPRTL